MHHQGLLRTESMGNFYTSLLTLPPSPQKKRNTFRSDDAVSSNLLPPLGQAVGRFPAVINEQGVGVPFMKEMKKQKYDG